MPLAGGIEGSLTLIEEDILGDLEHGIHQSEIHDRVPLQRLAQASPIAAAVVGAARRRPKDLDSDNQPLPYAPILAPQTEVAYHCAIVGPFSLHISELPSLRSCRPSLSTFSNFSAIVRK